MKKILFAADDSLSTQDAVDMVNHLLDAWPNAELMVLYVSALSDLCDGSGEDRIQRRASEIQDQASQEWFLNHRDRVRFKHVQGPTAITITTIAEEEHVDLIVLGSHGTGDVDRLLVGSVSHGVLYCARTPVMVVKNWPKSA